MTSEREYKTIKTPVGGDEVKIKAWLTGRERREIRSILLEGVKFSGNEANSEEDVVPEYNMTGDSLDKVQDKTFEMVIESINGSTENIVDTVLDMREQDYTFVVDEINAISNGITEEEEKK